MIGLAFRPGRYLLLVDLGDRKIETEVVVGHGWNLHWLVLFLVFSLVFAFAFRGLFDGYCTCITAKFCATRWVSPQESTTSWAGDWT